MPLTHANGNQIWNYTTGYYVDSDPTVSNGVVFFGSEDENLCFERYNR